MKVISKVALGLAVASSIFFTGCNQGADATTKVAKATITEESLGLRKTDLYSESSTIASKTEYRTATAGKSAKINRAFQDAPPMIPHDTEGMLPIMIGNNQCLGCHAPAVATSMGALPYPKSHMTDFRPTTTIAKDGRIAKEGIALDNTSNSNLKDVSIKTSSKLIGARYNCSQCHAPQSQGNLAVENTFEAVFTSKDGAAKSAWEGTKLMEGIQTIK